MAKSNSTQKEDQFEITFEEWKSIFLDGQRHSLPSKETLELLKSQMEKDKEEMTSLLKIFESHMVNDKEKITFLSSQVLQLKENDVEKMKIFREMESHQRNTASNTRGMFWTLILFCCIVLLIIGNM